MDFRLSFGGSALHNFGYPALRPDPRTRALGPHTPLLDRRADTAKNSAMQLSPEVRYLAAMSMIAVFSSGTALPRSLHDRRRAALRLAFLLWPLALRGTN